MMLLWCLQDGATALMKASENGHKYIVEFLLVEGIADFDNCKDHELVKDALTKYREMTMTSLDPWVVPDLAAMVVALVC